MSAMPVGTIQELLPAWLWLGNCLRRYRGAIRLSRSGDHEPIFLPILLISPRSHVCAASVL